ncbi:MAG: acyltransferase [Hungatella sp.]|nr:acyltransferase [Hungatella sp.]
MKNNIELNKRQTRNQTFQYLEALAIIMVIDDHVGTRIGFLSSIFPYNSFYMPLLVFISGYFYHKKPIKKYLIHKTKKLFLPYMVWNIIGNGIAYILKCLGIVDWYCSINLSSLKYCLINGPLSSINGASWFVIMLFYVSIVYNIFSNIFKTHSLERDIVFLMGYIGIGSGALVLCMKGYNTGIYLPILKTAFYLQFYHIGYFFHNYLETYVQSLKKTKVCLGCIFINVVLTCIYGGDINFIATSGMGNFKLWYLPLITSITGILFWYMVMDFLAKKIGEHYLIDFIAQNTFTIMETHLLFVNIPNFYVFFRIMKGIQSYPDFDIQRFRGGAWFRYNENTRLIGFLCGMCGSLLVISMIKQIKYRVLLSKKRLSTQIAEKRI